MAGRTDAASAVRGRLGDADGPARRLRRLHVRRGFALQFGALDFVEGHFYAALLAWLLVRRVQD